MSLLRQILRRLLGADGAGNDWRLQRRLERERPRPNAGLETRLRRSLAARWAAENAPPGLRLRVLSLTAAGCAFLIVAFVIAGS